LQTREEIRRIQRETGITTIFVTHDQEEAMSISDIIVVMKKGVIQQTGKPQEVYDDPANLFVAKFLGTPPINVFDGKVVGGKLFLGEDAVLDVGGVSDREVFVGIRPEGFIVSDNGSMFCNVSNVEVMGRDSSIVSTHVSSLNPVIRSIVDSDVIDENKTVVSFNLKPHKVFLFDKETEERIYFTNPALTEKKISNTNEDGFGSGV
jgi:multiple sugar transport system ATP-binding protein